MYKSPVYNIISVPIEKIRANAWNPNAVAPPEMKLLYQSIKEDGYTMPIVCYYLKEEDAYEIVDGYHRYTIMKTHKDIYERENGCLPVSIIDKPVTREKIKDGKKYYITYYTFTFAKKINNVYTSDSLAVKITSKGNLASLYVGDVGVFDNIGQKAFSISNITKANEKKIINAYQSLNYNVLEQEVEYQRLVVTPEGKLALYSSNKVSVVANKDETLLKTGICLLTYIDS